MSEINSSSSNNKRIAKNTMILYIRMFILMFISLYTLRVVLKVLGLEDFGIYNVIAGVISMFGFINGSMTSASQRFLSFDLGIGQKENLNKTFNVLLFIFFIFGLIMLIAAETIGLWFVQTKLNVPINRLNDVNFIYQTTILIFLLNLLTVPFNAVIISHEQMSLYGYISLIEGILRLIIVFVLEWINYDKLIIYSVLQFLVSLIITTSYILICKKKFKWLKFKLYKETKKVKEIFQYSSWNLLGAFSGLANDQGLNILMNLFFGPVTNASMAIATRVKSTLNTFVYNFFMAVNPQIVKSYAAKDEEHTNGLIIKSSKFGFFLVLLFSIPLFFKIDFILKLWLGEVTSEMIIFSKCMIIYIMVNTLEPSISQGVRATGNIKQYQILVSILTILTIPIAYIAFKLGAKAYVGIIISSVIYFGTQFFRLKCLKTVFPNFDLINYFASVIFRITLVSIISYGLVCILNEFVFKPDSILNVFLFFFTSIISLLAIIVIIGLEQDEKKTIFNFAKKNYKKYAKYFLQKINN